MIAINARLKDLKPSATLAINQAVKKLQAEGRSIVHLGFGQSPFPVPPLIQAELKAHAGAKAYLPTLGLPTLREAVAHYYEKEFHFDVTAEQVVIGPGSKELIFQLLMLIEGELLLPAPSWVSYGPQARLLNKAYRYLPTRFEEDYQLSPEILEKACIDSQYSQKILILNSPHNPTGCVIKASTLKALADVCRRHHVYVISDEIYAKLQFTPEAHESMQRYYPEGTIITGGLSKLFGAGGYRLGLALLPQALLNDLMPAWTGLISETYSCVSTPIQYAAVKAYGEFDRLHEVIDAMAGVQQTASLYLHQVLVSMGFRCPRPEGSFYLMPDLNAHRKELMGQGIEDANTLAKHLVEQAELASIPASEFGLPPAYLALRLAVVDYDGTLALQHWGEGIRGDTLIQTAAPKLITVAERLCTWMQRLTAAA